MTLAGGCVQVIRWNPEEAAELQRRRRQLLFYLARDPVWARLILPRLQRICPAAIIESLTFWQEFFTRLNPS